MKAIYQRNSLLANLGTAGLLLAIILIFYSFFNEEIVLGINSMYKPIKFALSIWIYAWTMAFLFFYVKDQAKVRTYSWVAIVVMGFEQFAVTSQAFRGEQSHFNMANVYGIILYALMGIFILTLTLHTLYLAIVFIRQKKYTLPPNLVLSIKIALIYFVIFSLFGGYISSLTGHTVGANDGGTGLPFLNWSTAFGDLRVAHFVGIHALQIIPVFAWITHRITSESKSSQAIWAFSICYFAYVCFVMIQAFMGQPFFVL